MKPKICYFCVACQRPKMLFETQEEADRFIAYNRGDILRGRRKAPVRSYYCEICGGWHVTSAWLKACVLYVANGNLWEKQIEDFVRWSLQYDLWCKMQFFGADIEAANRGDERYSNRGPRNLLELLPDEFTTEDALQVRVKQGMGGDKKKCSHMIHQWVYRKYVSQITDQSFIKSSKYRKH